MTKVTILDEKPQETKPLKTIQLIKCLKVTILGEKPQETKPLKTIQLIKCLDESHTLETNPSNWENIFLIEKNFKNGMDLMYVFDDIIEEDGSRKYSAITLGHFNDGLV